MPTYDYRCAACGYTFEEFQKMSDPLLTDCPRCQTPSLERLIGGGAGLLFKGSGFYLTDYKKTGSSSSASKAEHTSSDSSSATGSTSSPDRPSTTSGSSATSSASPASTSSSDSSSSKS